MTCPLLIFSQSDYLIQMVDMNSDKWQTVQIQISWLLQKPTDLDLHCLQRQGISGFSRIRVKKLYKLAWWLRCASNLWSGGCGFNPRWVGNILLCRLIMKCFLRSFIPFCWFKKGSCCLALCIKNTEKGNMSGQLTVWVECHVIYLGCYISLRQHS